MLRLTAQTGGQSNLEFIENKGQWDKQVRFRAELTTGEFYLRGTGYTVVLHDTSDLTRLRRHHRETGTRINHFTGKKEEVGDPGYMVMHSHAYKVSFVGASEPQAIVPEKALAEYNNYILGNDSTKWASNCKIYLGVTYKEIYPGVDLRYYTEAGRLKYDLIVKPGADVSKIALKYEGQDKLSVKRGMLAVKTTVGEVGEGSPFSYQASADVRKTVECRYEVSGGNTVRFKLGSYNTNETLVIDPTLVFCSFTGSKTTNWGFTATYGPDGSAFMGGIVNGSGFPVSTGAFQTSFAQGGGNAIWDVGIIKLTSNGSARVYATYIGGSSDDYPHSLVCDPNGQLVVLGRTYSSNFPVYPAGNTYGTLGGSDIFVTRLNAAGTGLVGSMKIGGAGNDGLNMQDEGEIETYHTGTLGLDGLIRNYGDCSRSEVILDGSGNIYCATTANSSTLTFSNSFQTSPFSGQDALVLKINPSVTNILFGAYLGGSNQDAAFVLDLNPLTQDIYVGGVTMSNDLKGTGGNVYQSTFSGSVDGFVSVLSNDGLTLRYTTYLSWTNNVSTSVDMVYGLKFDKLGFPYVMGTSTGTWPVKNAAYSTAGGKQFVLKLKQDLSDIVYSTVFGSPNATKPNISPVAFLVDRCQNVYISGWGGWWALSEKDPYYLAGTVGMPVTSDAIKANTDGHDFYFIVLQRDAASLLYGSFFGQTDNSLSIAEHVDGGTSRYDQNGIIYEGICANCNNGDPNVTTGQYAYIKFPTTLGAYAYYNGAGTQGCNEAVVKIAFNYSGVSAGLKLTLDGRGDSVGCVPLNVTVQDTVRNAKLYIWNFGDGSATDTTTSYILTHVYTRVGDFRISLVAIDSSTCNIADTVYKDVHVRDNRANLAMAITKNQPCSALSYNYDNQSTISGSAPPFTSTSFLWDFGDGTAEVAAPLGNGVNHSYGSPGTYYPELILVDTNYCNYPDTLMDTLRVAQNVKAQFTTPSLGCAPYYAVFNNTSVAGSTFLWDFGDGTTSTDASPAPHLYSSPGTYPITLTATDPNTCNITDTYSFTITVAEKPSASFTYTPNPSAENTPTVFSPAASADVIRYKWLFGDGDSTVKTTGDTVVHQYNATGTYNACLVVFNASGCTDTVCQTVSAIVNPLLDVPNAFTPGRFGQNGIVKVMGFGIQRMTFRIYNRWGQLVFQSNDRNLGWDGTYKGQLQPMDVYAYTLEAEFFDGTHVSKKGDITLVR